MHNIAICGKAGSGKNTLAKIIEGNNLARFMAFADPVKEIARKMFPHLPKKFFYGPSKYRLQIIPGAEDYSGRPLTVRQLLIDLGTQGRTYNSDIWVNVLEHKFNKDAQYHDMTIITDVRFRNEFDRCKKLGFKMIKIYRDDNVPIIQSNDLSEIEQDTIKDNEFDFIIHNNGTLDDLEVKVNDILKKLGI